MNSSLHQWAAEISTKQAKTLRTAVEGSMYVSCVCVCVCARIYYTSMRIEATHAATQQSLSVQQFSQQLFLYRSQTALDQTEGYR